MSTPLLADRLQQAKNMLTKCNFSILISGVNRVPDTDFKKHLNSSVNVFELFSAETRFESRPEHQLTSLRPLVLLVSLLRQIPRQYLKLGNTFFRSIFLLPPDHKIP